MEKYLEKKLTILDSPAVDVSLISEFDGKLAKCPKCNVDMAKKSASKNKNITIDFCEKCRGIWLDSTEIDRIEAKNFSLKEKVGFFLKTLIPHKE